MEFFTIIMLCLAAIILVLASITDLKTREVPDYLSYGMMFAGIGLRLLYSVMTFDWSYLLNGAFGLGIMFLVACALFYLGQWGGGDSKVLMALGALIGIDVPLVLSLFTFFPFSLESITLLKDFFLLGFLINLLFVGALYGFFWSVYLAILHKKEFAKSFLKIMANKKFLVTRGIALVLTICLMIYAAFSPAKYVIVFLAILIFLSSYLLAFMKSVEKACMFKRIPVSNLTEGDWIAEDVIIDKKIIASKKDLGISQEQIELLKSYAKKGKVKKVLIKEGMPFIPAFLIAFGLNLIMGNWVLWFML